MATSRPELPPMPARIAALPVERGYPVPWFVAWLYEDGEPAPIGSGAPDFRVLRPFAVADAYRDQRCWVCGGRLGVHRTFVVGPMCAINRTSAEPPSHEECASWSARACPFLARPHMVRRQNTLPSDAQPAPGLALDRNPGVTMLWTTRNYRPFRVDDSVLFRLGDPERVAFLARGREATRAEVIESIESGIPALRRVAKKQGPHAEAALRALTAKAMLLLPPA